MCKNEHVKKSLLGNVQTHLLFCVVVFSQIFLPDPQAQIQVYTERQVCILLIQILVYIFYIPITFREIYPSLNNVCPENKPNSILRRFWDDIWFVSKVR